MRVLHVSQGTTYGLARYLSDEIADQRARGWEVTLASPPDAWLAARCRELGAAHLEWPARRAPGPWVLAEARRLRDLVHRVAPEVVQLHSSKAGLAGRLALRGCLPTVFTPHAWSFLHGGPVTRFTALRWERLATRWTDVILCVSHGERDLGERAGIRCRWAVVPNAVDLDEFRPADASERVERRRALGMPDSTPIAVCIGRFVPQKGQDVLLRAWPEIQRSCPGAALYLVGDGPERRELETLAAGLDVYFPGEQSDVRSWLLAADVVVQPSRWEGLSLVTLEALACGSSIVATDVPGMRETFGGTDGAGAIVPPGDEHALVEAVVARLGDPDLVSRERTRARELAGDHGLERWGAQVAEVLEAARARASGRAGQSSSP